MRPFRMIRLAALALASVAWISTVHAEAPAKTAPETATPVEQEALRYLDSIQPQLVQINQDIWNYSELGLQEFRSSARLIEVLEKAGFKVKKGVSDMPTAFVAEYGSGKPVIGILAEYDALPDLSQEIVKDRKPAADRNAGHGCGHGAGDRSRRSGAGRQRGLRQESPQGHRASLWHAGGGNGHRQGLHDP